MDEKYIPVPIAHPTARKFPPTSMAHRSASPPSLSAHAHAHAHAPSSPQAASLSLYSSPPRAISPATSQIFERDVQESSSLPGPNSPAIPSHIQTENHIPPVLDASSEAITSRDVDTDMVEIVMHSLHQPAAVAVAGSVGGGVGSESMSMASSWQDHSDMHLPTHITAGMGAHDISESTSTYGSLVDTTADVRRLSFISFADVVQSEHAEQQHIGGGSGHRDRDSNVGIAGPTSLSSSHSHNTRSPSPMRSPVSMSSQGGGLGLTPPTSKSASIRGGMEMSSVGDLSSSQPAHPGLGTSGLTGTTGGSDLTVETMTQVLRKTGSGDLSGYATGGGSGGRSRPLSPREPLSPETLGT